ncbi:MAG: hypothetical protein ACTSRL_21650 [Candidatus Helarchaeota archaeon]
MASLFSSTEYKHYRRLICCKILKKDEKQFLKVLLKEGWKKTRYGKRKAKYSLVKEAPNRTRYHLRLFEVQNYYLVLIHHEPSLRGDLMFHIKGFLNEFTSKEMDLHEDKLELSNYQAGTDHFKHLIETHATLKHICDFKITEDELKIFTVKYGFISLKTPVEIYIEELKESLLEENRVDFLINIRKIFQVMEFKLIESNPEFLVFESPALTDFILFIQPINLSALDLAIIGTRIKNFKATAVVLICSKNDNLTRELDQKLAHLKISIIRPNIFLKIFNIYRHSPISHNQIYQIFKKGGIIDSEFVDKHLQHQSFQNIFDKTIKLFQFLKDQKKWIPLDTIVHEFVKDHNYTKEELDQILQFLTFPLINLVLIEIQKRRFRHDKIQYRALTNFDEVQFRLKNIQMFLDKII